MGAKGSGRYPYGSKAGKVGTESYENVVKHNKFITECRALSKRPLDTRDPEQVYKRYEAYMAVSSKLGVEQTITTLAKAFGTSGGWLTRVASRSVSSPKWTDESVDALADVLECVEAFAELALLDPENKNAAQRIFYMKNRHNWRDMREEVKVNVRQELPAVTEKQLDAIRQKYILQAGAVEVEAEVEDAGRLDG